MIKYNSSGSAEQGSAPIYSRFFESWKSSSYPRLFTFLRVFMACIFLSTLIFDSVLLEYPRARLIIFGAETNWIYPFVISQIMIFSLLAVLAFVSYKFYVDIEVRLNDALEQRFKQDLKIEELKFSYNCLCAEIRLHFMSMEALIMQTCCTDLTTYENCEKQRPIYNCLLRIGGHLRVLFDEFDPLRDIKHPISSDPSLNPIKQLREYLNQVDQLFSDLNYSMGIHCNNFKDIMPKRLQHQSANALNEMIYLKLINMQRDFEELSSVVRREGENLGNVNACSKNFLQSISSNVEDLSATVNNIILPHLKTGTKINKDEESRSNILDKLNLPIYNLPVPVRVYTRLYFAGMNTIGDLLKKSKHEVSQILGIGRWSMNHIINGLEQLSPDFTLGCFWINGYDKLLVHSEEAIPTEVEDESSEIKLEGC